MPGRPWTLLPTPGAVRHQGVFAPFSRLYGSRRRAGTDVFFMQKEEVTMDFLSSKIRPMYLKYLSAAFGSAMITSVYSIVDTAMVG